MPFTRCPKCWTVMHIRVAGDLKEWYTKHAPGKKVGEEVSLRCFKCWKASENAEGAPPNGDAAKPVCNSGVTNEPPSVNHSAINIVRHEA